LLMCGFQFSRAFSNERFQMLVVAVQFLIQLFSLLVSFKYLARSLCREVFTISPSFFDLAK
jgi:hypothetical protein